MTQGFTEIHTFYTSRENLGRQKIRVKYHCSVDRTKLCKHHVQLFDQHLLFQAIGKNSEVQSSECALYQRNYASLVLEAFKLALLQAPGQMMPYRFVTKSYTAWIFPTAYIKSNACGKNTTV